jgi:LacI family transcriptional regulator
MSEEKISIKKIAELTGYSVATVSRVINQNGRFSKETEKKIQKVIDEYGYSPHFAAKSLRTNSSRIVGIVLPSIRTELFAKTYVCLHELLQKRGYFPMLFDTHENLERPFGEKKNDELRPILNALDICGMVVISVRAVYDFFTRLDIPAVYIDCEPQTATENQAVIHYDMVRAGGLVADLLLEAGCRNIAAVTNLHTGKDSKLLVGISQRLEERGSILACPEALYTNTDRMSDLARVLQTAWKNGIRFDALVLPKDEHAVTATYALSALGVKIPEEVRIVGCDDEKISENAWIPVTTVHPDTDQAAALATDCLVQMMQGIKLPQRDYEVPATMIQRATT